MKTLKGKGLTESDFSDVESQLKELFYQLIFKPIVDLLKPHNAQVKSAARQLKNSSNHRMLNAKYSPIVAGINSGKIQYVDGIFSGDFNAAISSALKGYGAKFNKRTATWAIMQQALPVEIVSAIKEYANTARQLHDALDGQLRKIEMNLSYEIQSNPIDATKTINKMDRQFNDQYGDALGTENLSATAKEKLNRAYAASLSPYIKRFSSEQIADLRAMVKANAEIGYRFDRLVSQIEQRYDVTQTKAEFLARQETSIFTSKARQARFGDVGITKYVWRTAQDSEVREDHRKLNGREFEYSKPPIVDEATGRRAGPGQDFNCRCIDEPMIENVLANV